jgi:hypothetical protein
MTENRVTDTEVLEEIEKGEQKWTIVDCPEITPEVPI